MHLSKLFLRRIPTRCLGAFSIAVISVSCSDILNPPPARETVEPLLRQEAEQEKQKAEGDVNPALGVEVTWTIESVEVREQPDNDTNPWLGIVEFTSVSRTPELDGTVTQKFDHTYYYVWDMDAEAWTPSLGPDE